MTEKQILNELNGFLSPYLLRNLESVLAIDSFIQYCLVVTLIVKQYNSTEENEDRVCFLLEELAKKQFNKRKS